MKARTLLGSIFVVATSWGCTKSLSRRTPIIEDRNEENTPDEPGAPDSRNDTDVAGLVGKIKLFSLTDPPPGGELEVILPEDIESKVQELGFLTVSGSEGNAGGESPADVTGECKAPPINGWVWEDDHLIARSQMDFTSCMNSGMEDSSTTTIDSATLKIGMVFGCTGDPEQKHLGTKKTVIFAQALKSCGGSELSYFFQQEISFNFTSRASDTLTISGKSTQRKQFGDTNGSACVIRNREGSWTFDECKSVDRTEYADVKVEGSEDLNPDELFQRYETNLSYRNISYRTDATFFSSGTAALNINSWQGEIKFGGGSVEPRWTLKNGSDERSGVFFSAHGLSLLQTVRSFNSR